MAAFPTLHSFMIRLVTGPTSWNSQRSHQDATDAAMNEARLL